MTRHAPKYAKRRDENEAPIVEALRKAGCHVELMHEPVDLLVGYRGTNWLLEVKQPLGPRGGKPASERNPKQQAWMSGWKGQVCVVRTIEEALNVVGVGT